MGTRIQGSHSESPVAIIERFEDIETWKKARELTKLVYKTTTGRQFAQDAGLRDQIRRAAVSVMSNVAEGFERGGNKEFRQYLTVAKGSTGEVRAQLYVALDAALIDQQQFDRLCALTIEAARLLGGFIRYLGCSGYKGNKFK